MATNALVPFDQSPVPAHIAAFMGTGTNIGPKQTTNQLSIKGKVFRIVLNGEEAAMTKLDQESGEQVPKSMVKVVILDQNKARSRSYYEGGFDPDKPAAPVCWSSNGVVPDDSVSQKQSATCAKCQRAVKGGKITDAGKATTECSMNKRLVIVPATNLGFAPLLLKLPVTSIWDKDNAENEAKGYYAYEQYLDFLRQRGVAHTAAVVTNVKFDIRKEFPKLVFKADRWLTEDELATVGMRVGPTADPTSLDEIAKLLNAPEATAEQQAASAAKAAPEPEEAAPAPVAATKPAKPKAAAAPAPVAAVDEDDDPVPAAAATEDEDEGVDTSIPPANPAKAAAAPKTKPAQPKAAPAAAPVAPAGDKKGLANLLQQWENEE